MTAASSDTGWRTIDHRMRWAFGFSAVLVAAFLVSLILRATGSYWTPLDGWGVDVFELAMGGLCICRYFEVSWRSNQSTAKVFPLVLGAACISWAFGDLALTIESLGGATPSVPSVADGFYVGFFPLCYIALMMLIRRENKKSLVATSLDGLTAGLGVAALLAAFLFSTILSATGGGPLAAATGTAYPVGDLLLLALVIGGFAVLPREFRLFLGIASIALTANAAGDLFALLQPASKVGYVVNAVAWPISLLMLAIAAWVQPAGAIQLPNAETVSREKSVGFTLPAVSALAGIVVLLFASIGHEGKPAVALATATLSVAGVRMALTVRQAQALKSARFRSLIDNAWDIIVVAESDLEIAYITPSSERVLGYQPRELQAKPITGFVHPDDKEVVIDHLRELADRRTESSTFEVRMLHRNGVWRTIAWSAADLHDDPSVRGFVLNGSDVTEARQATEDLAAARDGALMASQAKSDFLSTMSHEIRTPMNGVIGLTELLLDTHLDADQRELASGVKVSAENLLVIVNDILDFSKIEAGKLEIEERECSVPGVVDDVGRILAATAHGKGLELLVDVHPDVPAQLLGDRVRIQQVLLNLASNGVKFTEDGEVLIRVTVIDENGERVALRFEVIDMGIGIAAADQRRLFRAFSQADSSTTRRFGGTGLGLAISRQLVDLMGGQLGLISAPGEGSTFWFELSLRRAEVTAHDTRDELRNLAGQRALIVDDNATNRMILRKQLHSWGVESLEAVDGYEALEIAAASAQGDHKFDFGIIDLNMPGMDGIELAGVFKLEPSTAAMKLLLLSSSDQRFGAAEAHVRGFAASLTKPVRPSELFDCLITSLNNSPSHPQPLQGTPTKQTGNQETMGTILLVEDNEMNQLVGSKVLTKLGYRFEIANHGAEAVRAVQARTFDGILMDCQMPEMDGYEATVEIRRLEGADRHTPIIAMTAAAMEGDREKCLTAGMDDYITKPVRPEAVGPILERWIARPQQGANGAGESDCVSDVARPGPLDPSQIELLRSLDDGDGAVFSEIVDQYVVQTTEGREVLARVMIEGDTQGIESTAHMLKGASANVGATGMVAVCAEMEMHGRAAQLDNAVGLVELFDSEFARVRDALRSVKI
jgi:two-component system sensor histidine kinase/response regulator